MGEVLAEVWNKLVIDNCLVTCEFVESSTIEPVAYEERWVNKHCRISRYFLQIVICTDEKCFDPFRTNWLDVFPDLFIPAPVQFRQSTGGLRVSLCPQAKSADHIADLWKRMAINMLVPQNDCVVLLSNMYCTSVKSAVKKRVCNLCRIYQPSMAAVKRQKTGGGCSEGVEIQDDDTIEEDDNECRNVGS